MQKAPTMAGIRLLCVLWDLSSGPVTETKARSGGYEPCGSGDHPESLENFTWFNKKKKERKGNEMATVLLLMKVHIVVSYMFLHFFFYTLWHMHGQHCLTTLCFIYWIYFAGVCARVFETAKRRKKKKKKRKRSRMRLFLKHFTTQHTGVTVQHPQFTGYMCVLLGGFV